MGIRRRARETALQFLFEWDSASKDVEDLFVLRRKELDLPWKYKELERNEQESALEFTQQIVRGVQEYQEEIDGIIATHATHWKLSRMSLVDRNILRMAIYEMIYCPEIPNSVSINEAIDIAKCFGSEDSGAFVNGVLDNIAKQLAGTEQEL